MDLSDTKLELQKALKEFAEENSKAQEAAENLDDALTCEAKKRGDSKLFCVRKKEDDEEVEEAEPV